MNTEMTCPKCHTSQPTSDTCIKCGIIIAKFREPSEFDSYNNNNLEPNNQTSYRQPQYGASDTPTLFSPKIIGLTLLIIIGGYFVIVNGLYAPKAGKFVEQSSTYINKRLGFKMQIPEEWNRFEPEEILPPLIMRKFGDKFYLLAGPEGARGPMMVVNLMSIGADNFSPAGWKMYIAEQKQNKNVQFSEIYEVAGYKVHSYGYKLKNGSYRENHAFIPKNGGTPIEIYFYTKSNRNNRQFHEDIEYITSSIKKTAAF